MTASHQAELEIEIRRVRALLEARKQQHGTDVRALAVGDARAIFVLSYALALAHRAMASGNERRIARAVKALQEFKQ
jgi:hypothetical protein